MTLQLTPSQEERLEHLAAQTHRTPEELVHKGFERFLSQREDLERAVEEGRAAARRGDLFDHEKAMRMMDEIVNPA